jgi:protocatechuate 3,4-dioxygenase beta subunit
VTDKDGEFRFPPVAPGEHHGHDRGPQGLFG